MVSYKRVYNAHTHSIVTKNTCTCHACRKKHGLRTKEDKALVVKEKFASDGLLDIPLFCRVFPEGLVGSCGFCWFGFCRVFEDGCVRWNELGDKLDYSVGLKNPFLGGD